MKHWIHFFKHNWDKRLLYEDSDYRTYYYGLGCFSLPKVKTINEKIRELTR